MLIRLSRPENAITGLRTFYSGLPIVGTLIAIFVMRNYDVTEQRANEVREALLARSAKVQSNKNRSK